MAKIKFKVNRGGVAAFLKSGAVQMECLSHANRIKSSAKGKYTADVMAGKNRAQARVKTASRGTYYRYNTGGRRELGEA